MDLLWPIKWVIELILVSFHTLFTTVGLPAASGVTWVLAVAGLVIVVRASMIPLFVKQILSQRNMLVIQPELQKLQNDTTLLRDREYAATLLLGRMQAIRDELQQTNVLITVSPTDST